VILQYLISFISKLLYLQWFFGTQQNWWVSSLICRLIFDKLLKCPAFYQFLGAYKNFLSNKLREFNSVDGLLSLSDKHKSI